MAPALIKHEANTLAEFIRRYDEINYNKDLADILTNLTASADEPPKIVQCYGCEMWFCKDEIDECPECGEKQTDPFKVGDKVHMPIYNSQGWEEGEECIVTGVETIDGVSHLIVIGEDGRSWCVEADETEKIE